MRTPPFQLADLQPWIELRFSRAAGPGGQNVNKVSTRVELLFDFGACSAIPDALRGEIARRFASRLSRDGRLRVVGRALRTQAGNRRAAEQRLIELLQAASRRPQPRRATQPTAGARERRLQGKRRRGAVKRWRGGALGE